MATVNYFSKPDTLFLIQLIYTEFQKYQKAVEGKGLSQEDFTTALKTKLEGIDLTKYSTTEQMNKAIEDALADVTGIEFKKVDVLPETGEKGYIYLVPNGKTGSNVYDEYYWDATNNKFELFGSTAIDLSGYLKDEDVVEIPTSEIQAAWDSVFGE